MKNNTIVLALLFVAINFTFISKSISAETKSSNEIINNIVKKANARKESTGVFLYSAEDERVLEEIVSKEPNNTRALHVLAWAYSAYERNKNSKELHLKGLNYAKRSYKICNGSDIFITEILAVAHYANGNIEEGDKLFKKIIAEAKKEKIRKLFIEHNKKYRERYAVKE